MLTRITNKTNSTPALADPTDLNSLEAQETVSTMLTLLTTKGVQNATTLPRVCQIRLRRSLGHAYLTNLNLRETKGMVSNLNRNKTANNDRKTSQKM